MYWVALLQGLHSLPIASFKMCAYFGEKLWPMDEKIKIGAILKAEHTIWFWAFIKFKWGKQN